MTQSLHPQVLSSSWVTSVSLDLLVSPPPALPLINSVSPSQPEIYLKNTNRSFPLLPALQWLLKALKLKSSLPNPADHNLQDLAGLTSFWFLGSAMLPLASHVLHSLHSPFGLNPDVTSSWMHIYPTHTKTQSRLVPVFISTLCLPSHSPVLPD